MEKHSIQADIAVENPRWNKVLPQYEVLIKRALEACRAHSDLPDKMIEVSISLSDDENVHILNREYRNKDKPTNVLSFPQIEDWSEGSADLEAPLLLLGDIVIALETIEREALEQEKTSDDHFTHMLIHSFLHLLSYDHETEEEASIMESLEIKILQSLGINNPYQTD